MEKIILKFKSPKLLNELTKAEELEPVNWIYIDETSTQLELNTETWTISANDISEKIDQWMVNEEKNLMKLTSDQHDDTFSKLDYTFAVSMIGQLTDKKKLIKYLMELAKIFNASPKENDKPHDNEEKDIENSNDNDKNKKS